MLEADARQEHRRQFQQQLTIRSATPSDRQRLHQIQLSAIRTLCAVDYAPEHVTAILDSKQRPPSAFCETLVAEHEQRVIGFGSLGWRRRTIDALFIDPDYVRLGVASRICEALEETATAAGVRKLEVTASLNGVVFYESAGFQRLGPQDIQVDWGQVVPCVKMRKWLLGQQGRDRTSSHRTPAGRSNRTNRMAGFSFGDPSLDPAALRFWAFAFAGLLGVFLLKLWVET